MRKRSIHVYELSSLSGKHIHRTVYDTALDIVKRCSNLSYGKTEEALEDEKIQDAGIKIDNLDDIISDLVKMQISQTSIAEIINKTANISDTVTQKCILHKIYKKHGTVNESVALDKFEKITKEKVLTGKDCGPKKIELSNGWSVYGKLDGCYMENEGLVPLEVKNRQFKFSRTLPLYEIVQIQIYIKIFGSKKAFLIERFNDKMKIHLIEKNDTLIDEVLEIAKINLDKIEKAVSENVSSEDFKKLFPES